VRPAFGRVEGETFLAQLRAGSRDSRQEFALLCDDLRRLRIFQFLL